jgi:hypothetical protein
MTQYTLTVGANSMTGNLSWNSNGTLNQLQIVDGFNAGGSQTCIYNPSTESLTGYDDLGRLVGYDCGSGQWGQTFSFDPFGNLTKQKMSNRNGTTWAPGYNETSNWCSICTYDADGNVLGDGNNVYSWDVYSKLAWTAPSGTQACGSSGRCATYDAFGRIVEQSTGSTYYERWITQLGFTAVMAVASPVNAYWPAPGNGKVIIGGNGSGYGYLHPDWLGNARITSDLSGNTIDVDQAYTPYGEVYDIFGSTASQYEEFATLTARFAPSGSGGTPIMWDTPNRELSMVGRWLSPDPAGLSAADPTNPQSWNRYAYVLNNPLRNVDPLGLDCVSAGDGSVVINSGDCPGVDPNNEYYYDCDGCLMSATSASMTENGSLILQLGTFNGVPLLTAISDFDYTNSSDPSLDVASLPAANNGNVSCNSTTGICVPSTMMKPRPAGCGAAIAQGAISLGLDVVGAIPAFGNVVSATAAGARAVNGIVAYGGAAYGIATGLPDESPVGAAGAGAGLGLTLADTALEGGKVIPVLGNFLSAGIGLYDGYQLAKTIGKCW